MCTRSSFWRNAGAFALVALLAVLGVTAERLARAAESDRTATEVRIGDEGVQVKSGRKTATAPAVPSAPDEEALEDSLSDSTFGSTGTIDFEDHGNDIVRMGADITVKPGKKVEGSVVAVGGSVTVYGEVTEDVVAVGGDVTAKPSAVIHGDAVAVGGTVNEDPGATIGGENVSVGFGALKFLSLLGLMAGVWSVGAALMLLLVLMLTVGIVLVLARNRMEGVLEAYHRRMGRSVVYGFLITILLPLIFLLLLVTVIGIPVAILLPFAWALASLVGVAASGIYLGRRLKPDLTFGWAALLGLGVLIFVQWLGGLIAHAGFLKVFGVALMLFATVGWCWAYFAGVGAIWITRFGSAKRVARLRGEEPPYAPPKPEPPLSPTPAPPLTPSPAPTAWEGPALGTPALPPPANPPVPGYGTEIPPTP